MERRYTLQDVNDYLVENYGLDWKGYKISNDDKRRAVTVGDFDGDYFYEFAVVCQGKAKKLVTLNITNDKLIVGGHKAPELAWKDFLDERYSQEQGLNK